MLWRLWLVIVSFGVALGGLAMIVAPELTRQTFSLLIFSSPGHIAGFGAPAAAYITLAHGVLGAVMFGWGVAFLSLLFGPFRRGSYAAWQTMTLSLTAWFVADTALSLWLGFWQNAVLNCAVAILFAIPLAATRTTCRRRPLS